MQLFLVVTSVLSLLTITVGRVVTGRLPLHQNVHIGDRATPSLMHEVIISIKLKQLDKLKAFVDDVSSPMSPNYGNHMTRTELAERYSNYEGLESVKSYFEKKMFVITKSSKYGEFIHVKGTITQWEDVLETKFYEMHQVKDMSSFNLGHTGSRKQRTETLLRAKEYTIPQEIQHHVQAMFNTIQIPPKFKKTAITSSVPIQPDAVVTPVPGTYLYDGYVTPQLLYQLYNITSNIGNSLTSQALYESLEEDYSPSDLTGFQNQFKLLVQPIEGDYGGYNSSDYCINPPLGGGCGEANLDVQYIMAVAQNIPTYYYYDNSTDFLITWAFNILNMENPPLVTSISYSGYESDFSQEYLDVFEALAITLSSIGVTIVASSGDDGVAGYLARYNSTFCGYNPQFPVSSPYVLAVGATQGPESSNPEIACSSDTGGVITTGGGFSDFYPMPSYQYSAVRDGYLAGLKSLPTNSAPVAGYSSTGRGYPDISALGYEYLLLIGKLKFYSVWVRIALFYILYTYLFGLFLLLFIHRWKLDC